MKKVFEPVTKSLENTSQDLTKDITESSSNNNKPIENMNNKLLEIMIDRGILASCLMSPLSKITNRENSSQFKLIKDPSSNRINDLSIKKTKPITLHDNLLTFRDTNKVFELKGDLLKMITKNNCNVDLASISDKKLMYEFAKEMKFDERGLGRKSTRDRTLIKLLNSPAVMASGVSKTKFLSSNPNGLCDRLKLILQEKQAGNKYNIITEEIVAIIDKLLEYKCISKKQHKQISIKCDLLNK